MVCVSLIAVAPQTISEHTQCRYMMPWFQEWASSDPALHRSDSPPRSWAGDVVREEKEGRGKGGKRCQWSENEHKEELHHLSFRFQPNP